MRHCLELMLMIATAGILLATSQARAPCATETVSLRSETSCGPVANLSVSSSTGCAISAMGADFGGLPTLGSVRQDAADAGVNSGFYLTGMTADGGNVRTCTALPADAGFDITCTPTCGDPDAGACEAGCTGRLIPQ
jgi:hypothetical protein